MKFTLRELGMMKSPLQKIANKELPIKVSWKIAKFLRQINDELELIESERIKLVQKYGTPVNAENTENSKNMEIKVSEENKEKFHNEFLEFLSSEVEIDFDPISINDLGDIELSSSDLLMLQKYVKE